MAGARPTGGIPRGPGQHGGGRPAIDLAGNRYGRLLVIERVPKPASKSYSPQTGTWWDCQCDCGSAPTISGERLRRGNVLHCGGASHRKQ
jgi:hypothetical protein